MEDEEEAASILYSSKSSFSSLAAVWKNGFDERAVVDASPFSAK
jgi:hypothetical protein